MICCRTFANRAFTLEAATFVLSHRNVKIRVFTHGLGGFVLLHSVVGDGIQSCICT
jgi:hypothetical protein